MRRARGSHYLLIAIGMVAGCSHSKAGGSEIRISFDPQKVGIVEAKYPAPNDVSIVSWLMYGDEDRERKLFAASVDHMTRCMTEAGFTAYPRRPIPESFQTPLARPINHLDASLVATSGYAVPEDTTGSYTDPVVSYYDALNESERRAFDAANIDCSNTEKNVLFENKFEEYESNRILLEDRMTALFDRFYSSDEVLNLYSKWSACMKQSGWDFKSPEGAEARFFDVSLNQDTGLSIAKADLSCRQDTNLESEVNALFRAAESNFLVDNEALVQNVMELSGRSVPT
jgi:hypothetical protein